jgi:hypothetical protein
MFLIRSAFWLALLVALVPSDPGEQARMYQTASYAVYRAVTFCDRNPVICTEAQAYWAIFKEKAAVGSRMAGDLLNERLAAKQAAQPTAAPPLLEPPLPPTDTLREADRTPEWRVRVKSHL